MTKDLDHIIQADWDEFRIQEEILNCIYLINKERGFRERQYNHGKMIAIIRELMKWKRQ